MVSQMSVRGATALGVFSVALSVMLAVLLVACGGGSHHSPDVASVEATTPAPEWVFDPPLQDPELPERIDYEYALQY